MTLRDDVAPVVDEARDLIDDLGLRLHTVKTRLRTWSGSAPGDGSSSDVDVTLTPTPKVQEPSPRLLSEAPGKYETGDRIVSKLSVVNYTKGDLDGGTLTAAQEFFILIDSALYRVMSVDERSFEWRLHVRRVAGR